MVDKYSPLDISNISSSSSYLRRLIAEVFKGQFTNNNIFVTMYVPHLTKDWPKVTQFILKAEENLGLPSIRPTFNHCTILALDCRNTRQWTELCAKNCKNSHVWKAVNKDAFRRGLSNHSAYGQNFIGGEEPLCDLPRYSQCFFSLLEK